jgi:hypothetical protein
MFSCTLSNLSFDDYVSIEEKILDLEKLLASEAAPVVMDGETRKEIVKSMALRMGRPAYIRRLSVKRIKRIA